MSHIPRFRLIIYPTWHPFQTFDHQGRPYEPQQRSGQLPWWLLPGRSYLLVAPDLRAFPILPHFYERPNPASIPPPLGGQQFHLEPPPLEPIEPPPVQQDPLAQAWQAVGLDVDFNPVDDDDTRQHPLQPQQDLLGRALHDAGLDDFFNVDDDDDFRQDQLQPAQCRWLRRPADLDAQGQVELLMMVGPGLTDPDEANRLLLYSPLEISFEHQLEPRPFPRTPTLNEKLQLCSQVWLERLTLEAVRVFLQEPWLDSRVRTLRLVVVYPAGTLFGPDHVQGLRRLLEAANTWHPLVNFDLLMRVDAFNSPATLDVLLPKLETCTMDLAYANPNPDHDIKITNPRCLAHMTRLGFCSPNRTVELNLKRLNETLVHLTPNRLARLCLQLEFQFSEKWSEFTKWRQNVRRCVLRQLMIDQQSDGLQTPQPMNFPVMFPNLVMLTLVSRRRWSFNSQGNKRNRGSLYHLFKLIHLVELRLEMATEQAWLEPAFTLNISEIKLHDVVHPWTQIRVLGLAPRLPDETWQTMQPERGRIDLGFLVSWLPRLEILVIRMPALVFAQCQVCHGQAIPENPDLRQPCGTHRFDFGGFLNGCPRLRRIYVLADDQIRYQWTGPPPGVEEGIN